MTVFKNFNDIGDMSEMIQYLSAKFELIREFYGSKQEASIELISILKDLDFDLKCAIEVLNKRKTINNWKYCNNGSPYIEGQVKYGEKIKLISDNVLSIDFENKIVRTNDFAFNLGDELVQE